MMPTFPEPRRLFAGWLSIERQPRESTTETRAISHAAAPAGLWSPCAREVAYENALIKILLRSERKLETLIEGQR